MGKSIDDLSTEISQLKDVLTTTNADKTNGAEVTYKVPHPDQEKHKGEFVDQTDLVSKLKASLVGAVPKLLTEEAVAASSWVKQIGENNEELKKDSITEWAETAGLGGFAATWEKFKEGQNWIPYALSTVGGLLVPVIGLMLLNNFTNIQRGLQNRILDGMAARFPSLATRLGDRTIAMNDDGTRPALVDRGHLQTREAGGLANLADPPNAATLTPLREALDGINQKIKDFNTEVRKVPNARSLDKTATAIGKIKLVVSDLNVEQVTNAAEALKKFAPEKLPDPGKLVKINKAMDKADPTHMKSVAEATEKLVAAQTHLEPQRWHDLPKAGTLRSAAKAAERLADAGHDVAGAFDALKTAAQQAAAVIGAPAGSGS
ncbi:hypothetical protein [Streptomyces sp. NPDC048623]|uniref:hypothetical protein n=1 Tax=Streptomyces sp. NPDC048623 TaxID=3155761 RepID=UPI003413340B